MVRIMVVYVVSQKASLATSEPVGGKGGLREHFKNRNTVEQNLQRTKYLNPGDETFNLSLLINKMKIKQKDLK